MPHESFQTWLPVIACALLSLAVSGCASHCEQTRKALMRETPLSPDAQLAQPYHIGCPDVIRVRCPDHPESSGLHTIEANGCIPVAYLGGVRVEGLTAAEAREKLADTLQVPADAVDLDVVEYRRQHVYVFGEVPGLQNAIPYQGSETVVELIRRAGGVTKEGSPGQVRVIRNSPIAGAPPQVFLVDLQAIVLRGDNSTNLLVQPNDQIYVPESKRARYRKCFHPWFKATAEWLGNW